MCLVLAACSTAAGVPNQPNSPSAEKVAFRAGDLLPVGELRLNFQWRQRVVARFGSEERSFAAVLSKEEGVLQLLGLGPMGQVGFVLRMHSATPGAELEVKFENHSPLHLPFDPRFILLDVQRVFYPWLPEKNASTTSVSGEVKGLLITESWQNGRLKKRRFSRPPDSISAGGQGLDVHISYEGWQESAEAPATVRLQNRTMGYVLEIETLDQQAL